MMKWLLISLGILSAFLVSKQYVAAQVEIIDGIEKYLEIYNSDKDIYEVGYSIDHNLWSEIHTWYGKTLEEATTAYTVSK